MESRWDFSGLHTSIFDWHTNSADGRPTGGENYHPLHGDGDLDAFVVNYNQANKVWLNNGSANFSDTG